MKRLVVDANILVRAVFGIRVFHLLEAYEETVSFYSPDICFDEVRRHIPGLAQRRHFDAALAVAVLEHVSRIVQPVDRSLYDVHQAAAPERISSRDLNDWPLVATSMLLDCPIWTEDQDFFGSGVATWTTATIEVYLRDT